MSHLQNIPSKSHIVAMYVILDLQTIYIMNNAQVYNLAIRSVSHRHKIDC